MTFPKILKSILSLRLNLFSIIFHQLRVQFVMNLIKMNKKILETSYFTVKSHVFLIIVFNLKFYFKIITKESK